MGPNRTKSGGKREPTPDSQSEDEEEDLTVEEAWESSASDVLILMEHSGLN